MSDGTPRVRPAGPVWLAPLAFLFAQVVFTTFAAQNQPDRAALDPVAYALLAAGPLALLLRRRRPVAVLVAVLAITVTYLALRYPYGPVFLSLVVAIAFAVLAGHRLAAWLVAGVGLALHVGLQYSLGEATSLAYTAGVAAWLIAVLAVSDLARARRERAAEIVRVRAEQARRQASEERLRIARELHDVLAHNISLINVQAGVALHLLDSDPAQARGALAAIKQESRDVLRELRSALDVLRAVDETAPRAPAPGLHRLDELVQRARAGGLDVHTAVHGTPCPLPAGVDLAAYRIVQEALTNVVRHAAAAGATVLLTYGEDMLTVQVDDDGRGGAALDLPSGGNGVPGMRERATALGGRLDAGPRSDGGFRVRAELPLS